MYNKRITRVLGAVAFTVALAGGALTASAGTADEENDDPLGLIGDGGVGCEAAQAAYVNAGWNPIDGDNFNNFIVGTPDPDFIRAFAGNDLALGLERADVICLGRGNDRGQGNEGNDFIYGQRGQDRLLGQLGNDHLDGGPQVDLCNGGPGADTFFSC